MTMALSSQAAVEALWQTVLAQTGPVQDWHVDNFYHHAARYLDDLRLIEALAPSGSILEIGSAPCHLTALMKMTGYAPVGVDINPDRVADFIRQFELDVYRCDVERSPLPFGDDAFPFALLCETFEHLRIDPAFVISEISRVLAPGGQLLLTTPNVYSLPSLARYLLGRSIADPAEEFGKLRRLGHMGHVREYSAREVARFLAGLGLRVESMGYRSDGIARDWKRKLLHVAYRVTPRRFRREIVVVARKVGPSPRLAPLVPLA
jgi:SAM-dependent methyltransferase